MITDITAMFVPQHPGLLEDHCGSGPLTEQQSPTVGTDGSKSNLIKMSVEATTSTDADGPLSSTSTHFEVSSPNHASWYKLNSQEAVVAAWEESTLRNLQKSPQHQAPTEAYLSRPWKEYVFIWSTQMSMLVSSTTLLAIYHQRAKIICRPSYLRNLSVQDALALLSNIRCKSESQLCLASIEVQLRHILDEHLARISRSSVTKQMINTDPEARANYALLVLGTLIGKDCKYQTSFREGDQIRLLVRLLYVTEEADKIVVILQHYLDDTRKVDSTKFIKVPLELSYSPYGADLEDLLKNGLIIESSLHQGLESMPKHNFIDDEAGEEEAEEEEKTYLTSAIPQTRPQEIATGMSGAACHSSPFQSPSAQDASILAPSDQDTDEDLKPSASASTDFGTCSSNAIAWQYLSDPKSVSYAWNSVHEHMDLQKSTQPPPTEAYLSPFNNEHLVEVGGVDVNQQDQTCGRPVLSWAASEGFEDIARYLLQVPGIKKNLRDFSGRTPISYAAGSGSISVLRLLLDDEGIEPSIPDHQGRSPLDWARLNHNDESAQELSCLDLT